MSEVNKMASTIFRAPDPLSYDSLQTMITNWRTWLKQFDIFLTATEYAEKDDPVKVSMFLNLIGPQGTDLYESFTWDPETDSRILKKVIEKFNNHMQRNKNVTVNRYAFFNYDQRSEQTIDDYIKELTILRKDCEFQSDRNINDTLLRDKIISGLCDKGLKEKLLRLDEDKSNLATVVATCRMHEISKDQSVLLESNSDPTVINMIRKPSTQRFNRRNYGNGNFNGNNGNNRTFNRRGPVNQTPQASPNSRRSCRFCGLFHDYGHCTAFGKRCGYCNKLHHVESVCFQKRRNIGQVESTVEDAFHEQEEVSQVSSLLSHSSIGNTFFMSQIDDEHNHTNDWNTVLKINMQKDIMFRIDSGADVSIISLREYKTLANPPALEHSEAKLRAYNQTNIAVLGKCKLYVSFEDNPAKELQFLVAEYASVISGYHAEVLNLVKRMFSIQNFPADIDRSIFSGLGCMKEEIKLHVDNACSPVVHAPRKVPYTIQDKLKIELDRMVKLEVIYPIQEPTEWVSSLVIVEKPDGGMRLCIDPKDLNKAIKRHYYPMRTAEYIFDKMSSACVFSKLDCTSGYWQIKVDEESSRLLCFNTPFGRYCFKRLPFGIHIASEIFQQKMEDLLVGLDGVANAQDDIIVWGSNQAEHDRRLRKTIDILGKAGLKLNESKCRFSVPELIFLGHKVSKDGISPDPSKVEAIQNMPVPTDKLGVQRLLGVINYVGKFIPNLSSITAPLRKLIEVDNDFVITKEHESALADIKNALMSDTVLKIFDSKRETKIGADASKFGLGAVLMQKHDTDWMPVAYASRSLTKTEQKYAQIEKECLSAVFACAKFHNYVYGKSFVVENDHKPLQTIFKKDLNSMPPRIQRMMLALIRYPNMEIRYIPGSQLKIPDTLSRAPLEEMKSEHEDIDYQIHAVYTNLPATEEIKSRFQCSTSADTTMSQLLGYVRNGWPVRNKCLPDLKHFWGFQDEITEVNGILYKGSRIIVPYDMRQYVKERVHMGHLGIVKCQERAKTYFYWAGMNDEIKQLVTTCGSCQKFRNAQPKQPNMPIVEEEPWSTVGCDIFHHNSSHYLIVTDYYSSYPEVILLKQGRAHGTSKQTIEKMKHIFARHGIPKLVISDGGPQFTATEFKQFAKQWQFAHEPSSPHYPKGNGRVERSVQTVKQLIKKAIDSKTDVEAAILAYRTTPLQDCKYSPAQLLLNRTPRNHLNAHLDADRKEQPADVKQRPVYKQKYTNQHSTQLPELNPGDNVRIREDNMWLLKGTVIKKHHTPRSFVVQTTDGRTFRRNRQHLLKTQEKWKAEFHYEECMDDDIVYIPDCDVVNGVDELNDTDTESQISQEPLTPPLDFNSDGERDVTSDSEGQSPSMSGVSFDGGQSSFSLGDFKRYSTRSNFGVAPKRHGYFISI